MCRPQQHQAQLIHELSQTEKAGEGGGKGRSDRQKPLGLLNEGLVYCVKGVGEERAGLTGGYLVPWLAYTTRLQGLNGGAATSR